MSKLVQQHFFPDNKCTKKYVTLSIWCKCVCVNANVHIHWCTVTVSHNRADVTQAGMGQVSVGTGSHYLVFLIHTEDDFMNWQHQGTLFNPAGWEVPRPHPRPHHPLSPLRKDCIYWATFTASQATFRQIFCVVVTVIPNHCICHSPLGSWHHALANKKNKRGGRAYTRCVSARTNQRFSVKTLSSSRVVICRLHLAEESFFWRSQQNWWIVFRIYVLSATVMLVSIAVHKYLSNMSVIAWIYLDCVKPKCGELK